MTSKQVKNAHAPRQPCQRSPSNTRWQLPGRHRLTQVQHQPVRPREQGDGVGQVQNFNLCQTASFSAGMFAVSNASGALVRAIDACTIAFARSVNEADSASRRLLKATRRLRHLTLRLTLRLAWCGVVCHGMGPVQFQCLTDESSDSDSPSPQPSPACGRGSRRTRGRHLTALPARWRESESMRGRAQV